MRAKVETSGPKRWHRIAQTDGRVQCELPKWWARCSEQKKEQKLKSGREKEKLSLNDPRSSSNERIVVARTEPLGQVRKRRANAHDRFFFFLFYFGGRSVHFHSSFWRALPEFETRRETPASEVGVVSWWSARFTFTTERFFLFLFHIQSAFRARLSLTWIPINKPWSHLVDRVGLLLSLDLQCVGLKLQSKKGGIHINLVTLTRVRL